MAALLAWGCSDQVAPTSVADPRFANGGHGGGGGGDPVVEAVDPNEGVQGQTLDIVVGGQGFEDGDQVLLGIDGTPVEDITTNATMFSTPESLQANITISGTAELASYDVLVYGGRGRKGIGTALFTVKLGPHANAIPTDLGSLGGFSEAFDINDSGEIVGRSETSSGPMHAVYWGTDHQIEDLHAFLGNPSFGWAFGINDSGQVVGDLGAPQGMRGFVLDHATGDLTVLELPDGATETHARDINDAGLVVGTMGSASAPAGFVWDGIEMKALPGLLPGGSGPSRPQAVNGAGHVVGAARGGTGSSRAVIWLDTNTAPIDLTGNADNGYAYGVSDPVNGLVFVAGQQETPSDYVSVLWTVNLSDGSFTVVSLASSSYAFGVNTAGEVVGDIGSSKRAYMWRTSSGAPVALELGALVGRAQSSAHAVNEYGLSVGWSQVSTKGKDKGLEHAVLWSSP